MVWSSGTNHCARFFAQEQDGSAEQMIQPVLPFDIAHLDLRRWLCQSGKRERAEEAQRFVSAPFDLTQGPLLRVALIRIAAEREYSGDGHASHHLRWRFDADFN